VRFLASEWRVWERRAAALYDRCRLHGARVHHIVAIDNGSDSSQVESMATGVEG
jgi:hypothetical protein